MSDEYAENTQADAIDEVETATVGPDGATQEGQASDAGAASLAPNSVDQQAESSAATAAASPEEARQTQDQRRMRRYMVLRTALLMVVALVAGMGVGFVVFPKIPFPGTAAAIAGKQSVDQEKLDTPMGTYTYRGKRVSVTVRDAIEETSSLDAARNADGTYQVPSADAVLAVARNELLLQQAADQGITATDADARAYARDMFGTDDLQVLSANYNIDADRVLDRMRDSAVLRKLRDTVVDAEVGEAPQEPEPVEEGQQDVPSEAYAAYIVELVGDEWDAQANTWASDDGAYRKLLRDYTISNEAATYSAAKAAYEYALAQYGSANQQVASEWTAYVNETLSQVTVELSTLVA